jgi:hypothetical protein
MGYTPHRFDLETRSYAKHKRLKGVFRVARLVGPGVISEMVSGAI